MSTSPFCRYDLRTTDTDAARDFYVGALGLDFTEEGSVLGVWPLHEQARARGAPAHWLGHVAVADVAATVEALLARGSQPLGPPLLRGDDGEAFAILRDPCEAVMAVRETSRRAKRPPVAWHHLNTRDLDRSWAVYAELFGWSRGEVFAIDGLEGGLQTFGWGEGGEVVGSVANTARRPGVHPHWLFHFPVADLERTLAAVTARGGRALDPMELPDGGRVAACEDPQGAAFGLVMGAAPRK